MQRDPSGEHYVRGADAPEGVDFEGLLLEVREIVERARTMPMSSSVLVNREELLEIIDDALDAYPEELRQARRLLRDRGDFLARAQRDADDLVEQARVQASRMVERAEIVREAKRRAQALVDSGVEDARRIRHEAEDFVDQRLAAFEVVLNRTLSAVHKGREQLLPSLEEGMPVDADGEADLFFDQDEP